MLPKETYKTIKNVALKKQSLSPGMSSIDFAKQLGIEVKNSVQSRDDFPPGKNPLNRVPAVLAKTKDGYVIYYDDNHPYKNYFILHEATHYLLKHCYDTPIAEEHANLLACLFLIPPDILVVRKLFTAQNISKEILIPEDTAKHYIEVLETHEEEYIRKKRIWKVLQLGIKHKGQIIICIGIIFVLVVGIVLSDQKSQPMQVQTPTPSPITAPLVTPFSTPLANVTEGGAVITKSGDAYHLSKCKHVRDKQNTTTITVDEAIRLGYKPCADCMR